MKNTEDQIYIDKVKKGELASYRFLVERYQDMVYTIAIRILRNVEDAEDVAQESFIKAYQQLHRFEGKSKFSTWLYTIVYRTSISRLQKNGVPAFSMDEETGDNFTYDHAVPQIDHMLVQEQSRFIKQAISKLPEMEGLLITLFYMNENSVKEIEEITGLSSSNIKVKLFRARKTLETALRFLL